MSSLCYILLPGYTAWKILSCRCVVDQFLQCRWHLFVSSGRLKYHRLKYNCDPPVHEPKGTLDGDGKDGKWCRRAVLLKQLQVFCATWCVVLVCHCEKLVFRVRLAEAPASALAAAAAVELRPGRQLLRQWVAELCEAMLVNCPFMMLMAELWKKEKEHNLQLVWKPSSIFLSIFFPILIVLFSILFSSLSCFSFFLTTKKNVFQCRTEGKCMHDHS